jgi:hypothetical protein
MKTADGKVVARNADGKIVESSSTSTSSTNASIKRSSSRNNNTKHDKTSSATTTTTTTHKMRPTQLLVSKNEGNTISSWLRDIGVILIPMYIMYMLATHPLIKDIGQPHTRKLTKSELVKKMLYEQNQKLEYQNAIYKYNFMTAVVDGGKRCYEFPSMEITSSWKPPALFTNRYKGFLGNKKDDKKDRPQGVVSKARRKWGPHAWKDTQRQQEQQEKKEEQVVKRQGVVANARKRWLHS